MIQPDYWILKIIGLISTSVTYLNNYTVCANRLAHYVCWYSIWMGVREGDALSTVFFKLEVKLSQKEFDINFDEIFPEYLKKFLLP